MNDGFRIKRCGRCDQKMNGGCNQMTAGFVYDTENTILEGVMNMMKWNTKMIRPLVLGLVLALLSLGGMAAFAMESAQDFAVDRVLKPVDSLEAEMIDAPPAYTGLSGVVKEIISLPQAGENVYRAVMEGTEGEPFSFTVTETTVFFTDERPVVGDTVTGFYDRNAPIKMIYPPQYTAAALGVETGDTNLFVGHFDNDLVDTGNRLMLIIVEETLVQLPNGEVFEGSLKNRTLAVMYGASTRSIPAQTRPEKVIVLTEKELSGGGEAVPPISEVPVDADKGAVSEIISGHYVPDVSGAGLVVEHTLIDNAPAAWTTENGVIMVPLKHIAEALGCHVMWNADLQMVMLSDSFTVTIGQDAYVDMSKEAPVTLGTAPEIREGRTFVPLHFFKEVVPLNNAYFFENQIVIDNQEPMN
ncbi:MAG: copper amine oxidase N-terminal domain-containing protein [Bacillota bacterium]|nr:copper amine oxidase N-terminal domain-containing protein [Bacillota bacterium]MDW7677473.1 copper amine oxidase N-terminal domain-containing protein [Bacillota bacterium]